MSFLRPASRSGAQIEFCAIEDRLLAPCAMRTSQSRGRRHPEPAHPYRTDYVRDRDRIVHSAAFRRLMYKTQVFVGQPSDHQRTRLTHTLEVAQIARTIARNLRLNEDLTEAMALAHDLGHPPFGHAGERALDACTREIGGFDHNRQGLRLLERLEQRYPAFPGLNLSYEILETIALRSRCRTDPEVLSFGPERRMLAEGQAVDAADSIAYTTHDLDDALRDGLIAFGDLAGVELWRRAEERAGQTYGAGLAGKQLARAIIRSLIDLQVGRVLEESARRIAFCRSVEEVQMASTNVVELDAEVAAMKCELQEFLLLRVYRHPQVVRTTHVAERMVSQLFDELLREPKALPEKYRGRFGAEPPARIVCDYIAGMTDRFAQARHRELFQP